MKQKFSSGWKSSIQKRKQRKYRANAPLHLRTNLVSSHLDKPLREKYKKRAMPLRTGDKVKVMTGSNKKKIGKVIRIDKKKYKIYIEGVEIQKKSGEKVFLAIDPSNVMITELNLEDKKRIKSEKNEPS